MISQNKFTLDHSGKAFFENQVSLESSTVQLNTLISLTSWTETIYLETFVGTLRWPCFLHLGSSNTFGYPVRQKPERTPVGLGGCCTNFPIYIGSCGFVDLCYSTSFQSVTWDFSTMSNGLGQCLCRISVWNSCPQPTRQTGCANTVDRIPSLPEIQIHAKRKVLHTASAAYEWISEQMLDVCEHQ